MKTSSAYLESPVNQDSNPCVVSQTTSLNVSNLDGYLMKAICEKQTLIRHKFMLAPTHESN